MRVAIIIKPNVTSKGPAIHINRGIISSPYIRIIQPLRANIYYPSIAEQIIVIIRCLEISAQSPIVYCHSVKSNVVPLGSRVIPEVLQSILNFIIPGIMRIGDCIAAVIQIADGIIIRYV